MLHTNGDAAIDQLLGKLADLVVLDQDPLKVPSQRIKDIKIVATYNEGQRIYPLEQPNQQ